MKTPLFFFLLVFTISACRDSKSDTPDNYYEVAAFAESGINMVVEIPAGTNHKIEYDPDSNSFKNDIENGKDRVVKFLPYPGNYGFIPSTLMDKSLGGDGDALDILLIGEALKSGTVIVVKPVATLLLKDGEETDTKIIAIPLDSLKRIINPDGFQEFIVEYDAVRIIIENWFLNYKGKGKMELLGWQDESFALREIKKWQLTKPTLK